MNKRRRRSRWTTRIKRRKRNGESKNEQKKQENEKMEENKFS